MGRENISKFANHRDPKLYLGDVNDWQTLENVFEGKPSLFWLSLDRRIFNSLKDANKDSLNVSDHLEPKLWPDSQWERAVATRRWKTLSDKQYQDEVVLDSSANIEEVKPDTWMLEERLRGAVYAYWYSLRYDSANVEKLLKQDFDQSNVPATSEKVADVTRNATLSNS
ncbi:MAG: hypothetical protein R3C05_02645 [Pirellulaceae bacterium]